MGCKYRIGNHEFNNETEVKNFIANNLEYVKSLLNKDKSVKEENTTQFETKTSQKENLKTLEEQKQEELIKAEEEWRNNVDEKGYPKKTLSEYTKPIEEKYKKLTEAKTSVEEEIPVETIATSSLVNAEEVQEIIEAVTQIKNISPKEFLEVTNHLVNTFISNTDKDVKIEFEKKLKAERAVLISTVDNLSSLESTFKLSKLINENKEKLKKVDSLLNNLDIIYEYTHQQLKKLREDLTEERNYSKESYEENPKKSGASLLKRLYFGIKNRDANGNVIKGFLNFDTYVGYDVIDDTVKTLLTTPVEIDPSFDLMMKRLEQSQKDIPWIKELVKTLREGATQNQNLFVSENARHNLSMVFIMYSKNRNNNYTVKNFYTNANAIEDVIQTEWKTNINNNTSLIYWSETNNSQMINVKYVKSLLQDIRKNLSLKNKTIDSKNVNALVQEIVNSIVDQDKWTQLKLFRNKALNAPKAKSKYFWTQYYNLKQPLIKEAKSKIDILKQILNLDVSGKNYGVSLSDEAINEIISDGLWTTKQTSSEPELIEFSDMLKVSRLSNGIFGNILWQLQEYVASGQDSIPMVQNGTNSVLQSAHNNLKKLAKIENKYVTRTSVLSFRDNKKLIYAKPLGKFGTDVINDLKNAEYRKQYLDKPFNQNSLYLELLENNYKFRTLFTVHHSGITALKELNKKTFGENDITHLTLEDREIFSRALLQDTELGNIKAKLANGFEDFRIGRLMFPTMSDKSQMLILQTALLNIQRKHFNDSLDNLDSKIKEILYSQLVEPELKRILDFHKNGSHTTIEGVNEIGGIFLTKPYLNKIEYQGNKVITLIKEGKFDSDVQKEFMHKAKILIENDIKEKVDLTLQKWKKYKKGSVMKFFNSDYINNDKLGKTLDERLKVAAYDYIINTQIGYANISMLATGDPVLYGNVNEKKLKPLFNAGDIYSPKFDDSYQRLMRDTIDVNIGKRLAEMLAPKKKNAESADETYLQVFLKDYVSVADNIASLASVLDDKTMSKEEVKTLEDSIRFETGEIALTEIEQEQLNERLNKIEAKFPNTVPFFFLKGSDAQEYTTVAEHIYTMFRQGELSDKQFKDLLDKYEQQMLYLIEDKEIPFELRFSTDELKIIFQPQKPIYAGLINDEENNMLRMMYIKSSSFPLVPQLTKGFELDKLRKSLETLQLEQTRKKIEFSDNTFVEVPSRMVRASYSTANKVGASTNAIRPFTVDNKFNPLLKDMDFANAIVELDRRNFGIQQKFPTKFANKDYDEISLGTQMLKLLFSGNITNLDSFEHTSSIYTQAELAKILGFENVDLSKGRNLQKVFNKTFIDYMSLKKENLLKSFGLNKNFEIIYPRSYLNNLERIIKEEALARGYKDNTVKALKLFATLSINYQGKFDEKFSGTLEDLNAKIEEISNDSNYDFSIESWNFNIPLWFLPESNKYESLLNSIINNKLVKVKLPGTSLVVTSEAGFNIDPENLAASNIIFTKHFDFDYGKLKAARYNEKGELISKTQAFIPSRLRDRNGKLIEFISEDGLINSEYVKQDEETGIMYLKNIDENLLDLSSFRIPTSSHVSMIQLEIAGFLPSITGDQIILPSNMTVQKGIDNDGDKENVYLYHTYQMSDGRILTINRKNLKTIQKDINDTREIDRPKQAKNIEEKMYENELAAINRAVLSNSNKEVQKQISSALSMQFGKSQKALFLELQNLSEDLSYWTNQDFYHQNAKMEYGSIGKMAIGVYSNSLVLHSQIANLDKQVRLRRKAKDKKGKSIWIDDTFSFGNLRIDGILGKKDTLKPNNITPIEWKKLKRSIVEAFAEKQNMATDNEKEQILSIVGVNSTTIGVENLMSLLGIDKDMIKDKNGNKIAVSLPYLLISQPIIKDFVHRMNTSLTEDYNPNLLFNVIEDLYREYGGIAEMARYNTLTGQNLYDELITEKDSNSLVQISALSFFLKLRKQALELTTFNSQFSINKDGLNKSFFNVLELRNFLLNPEVKSFENIEALIGEYVNIPNKKDIPKEAIKIADETFLIPSTPVGAMLAESVTTGYNMFKEIFPYNAPAIQFQMSKILENVLKDKKNINKVIETKQLIFQEFKKFLYSSKSLGILNIDPQQERYRLLIDNPKEDKVSLATYLKNILLDKRYKSLTTNALLSNFSFDKIDYNGYSILKFNASKMNNFDERKLDNALIDLLADNQELPNFNGKQYSTQKLVDDLIKYVYVTGSLQGAIEYSQYIPIEILEKTNFIKTLKKWNELLADPILDANTKDKNGNSFSTILNNFHRQFMQHFPEKVNTKLDLQQKRSSYNYKAFFNSQVMSGTDIVDLEEFTLHKDLDNGAEFISIYVPTIKKGRKKFILFERQGDKYIQIPVLGTFGASEYSIIEKDAQSNLKKHILKTANVKTVTNTDTTNTNNYFGIQNKGITLKQVVDNILKTSADTETVKVLQFFKDNNLLPEDIKVQTILMKYNGVYKNKTITINKKFFFAEGQEQKIAKIFTKELIHSTTADYMRKYVDKEGNRISDNTPASIENLILLFNTYRKKILQDFGIEAINQTNAAITERKPLTPEYKEKVYPATSIFEFVEVMFTENATQSYANKIKYASTNKTFYQKFIEFISKFLSSLSKDNVSYNTILTTLEIMKESKTGILSDIVKDDVGTILKKTDKILENSEKSLGQENKIPSFLETDLYKIYDVPKVEKSDKNCNNGM